MKVSLDLQPCCREYSGIGYYTLHIAKELSDSNDITYQGNVRNFKRADLSQLYAGLHFPVREVRYIPGVLFRLMDRCFKYIYNLLFGSSDITQFFGYTVPVHMKGKVVDTVYDMVCFRFPETMEAKNRYILNHMLLQSIQRSDHLVTISEFSKKEIIELTGYPENKITIIYPAASIIGGCGDIETIKKDLGITKPYLLFVGSIEPRKNLQRLIQAYNDLREQNAYAGQLILCGGKGWKNDAVYEEAGNSKFTDDIIFTGYVSDEVKNTLYKNSDLFVYPSIYEGFGIPPLEAMYWGIPVVSSNAASLPEVGGDAVCYVDPYSVEDITRGISKVLSDSKFRELLVQRGKEQYQKFSWEKSARKLEALYKSMG